MDTRVTRDPSVTWGHLRVPALRRVQPLLPGVPSLPLGLLAPLPGATDRHGAFVGSRWFRCHPHPLPGAGLRGFGGVSALRHRSQSRFKPGTLKPSPRSWGCCGCASAGLAEAAGIAPCLERAVGDSRSPYTPCLTPTVTLSTHGAVGSALCSLVPCLPGVLLSHGTAPLALCPAGWCRAREQGGTVPTGRESQARHWQCCRAWQGAGMHCHLGPDSFLSGVILQHCFWLQKHPNRQSPRAPAALVQRGFAAPFLQQTPISDCSFQFASHQLQHLSLVCSTFVSGKSPSHGNAIWSPPGVRVSAAGRETPGEALAVRMLTRAGSRHSRQTWALTCPAWSK